MKTEKDFPNGFTDWLEAHYKIVMAIEQQLSHSDDVGKAWDVVKTRGTGGLYNLSEDLTDKFELEYESVMWGEDLEYIDEMEAFIKRELY